ncbi:MAG: hypothetical protein ABSF53_13415 [Terracidiphilus sp.]|jgi:hypothetical protein
MIAPTRECSFDGTHRLIPSKYSQAGSVLGQLADDDKDLQALVELDGSTNSRLLGEEGLLLGSA